MADRKYVAGRGFNTGSGNYYDWSQNTDNSVQGNTFLFLGASGGGGGKSGGGKGGKRLAQEGQYGFKRFWRGRSELSGIGASHDWRDMKRPAIREGYGPLKAPLGAKTAGRVGRAVVRNITSRGSAQPGGAVPMGPSPRERGPIDMQPIHVEGARPPGTEFDPVAFHGANANYLESGTIQGPSGMPPLGVSSFPRPPEWNNQAMKRPPVSFT